MEKPKPYKLEPSGRNDLLEKLRQKKFSKMQRNDDEVDNNSVLEQIRDLLSNINDKLESFLED